MSSTMLSETPVVDGLDDAALLGLLVEVVARLGRQELGGAIDDDALTASVKVLHRAETMVAAEKLRRLGEVDARAAYTAHGARSTADLLTGFGLTRGEARTQEQTARALPRLSAVASGFARGQLGAGQAAVAARALADLPAGGDGEADRAAVGELDRLVANEGMTKDRRELGRTVDRWAHQRRPGEDPLAERERRAHQRRHLWAGQTADGDLVLEGRLTPVVHARLGALLDPLARPSGPDDPRSSGQRRHDALGHLLDLAAGVTDRHPPDGRAGTDRGVPDGNGGPRAGGSGRPDGSGGAPAGGDGRPDGSGGAPAGDRDDRGAHAVGGGGGGSEAGGDWPAAGAQAVPGGVQVLLVTTPDALHGRPGAAPSELDGYGPVSSATARQLCCDATITAIVADAEGRPLDAGRTRREPTRKQRLAVIARDRRCVGCGAPARRCQIHHVRWWSDLGPTDIANLCLLCPGCHTNVHHFGWTVTRYGNRYRAGPRPAADQRRHPP